MVTNDIIAALQSNGITDDEINALQEFNPRDGFEFPDENDFKGMMEFLQLQEGEEEMLSIVPILTDNNSNYLCVYIATENKGRVCYLSHDEINLNPIFRDIKNMIKAIVEHPDAWDVYDLPKEVFDFEDLPF